PHVRQRLAQNLAYVPGDTGPPIHATETPQYEVLSRMYPNRVDEMATYEGLANVIADHYGDFSASMGNFRFADDDHKTRGYVRWVPPYELAGEIPLKARQNAEVQQMRSDYPRSRSGAGSASKPFIMGMRPQQERMNVAVQVDPFAPSSTYVHEMSHAADIQRNPYTEDYIGRTKRAFKGTLDEEMVQTINDVNSEADKLGMSATDFLDYVSRPTETLARLNAIRYDMIIEAAFRGQEPNAMDYEYAYDDIPALMSHGDFNAGKAFKQLAAVYGAENVVDMLNEIF
ncbi:MAG: hypothetical protein VXB01_04485, partial [Opitutae bacterium]